ncbi:MAG: Nitroreductase [Chloroflexi bacterium]|nr:MAG: Nitroreductase [Chloroflexota bacterium]
MTENEPMDVFDVMYHCRAMRRLDTREVPEALLRKLVKAGNQAPSGSNMQVARWIVVRDPAVKRALADLNRRGVEGYVGLRLENLDALGHQSSEKQRRMLDAVMWQMQHMHELPALIVACAAFEERVTKKLIPNAAGSVWPGVQNLLLAARALGLGAAPTTLALGKQEAVAEALQLPETMAAYCLIPVGYPLGKFGPVTRKPLDEVMRFDRWSA